MHIKTTVILVKTLSILAAFFMTSGLVEAIGYDDQGCINTDVVFNSGRGCWVYHDNGANADKPVRVWYYYPPNFKWGSRKVVFVMHGTYRNAQATLDNWLTYADEYGALIVAPEFSREHYPKERHYGRGNIYDRRNVIRSPDDWTYSTIEEIFDRVRLAIPDAPQKYSIQGHSAGGQFVHRMVMLSRDFRIDTAVAANAGWYLLPNEDTPYSCGIMNIPSTSVDLAYAIKLVITLGTEDNNPSTSELSHRICAEKQGTNRFDRGHFFYDFTRNNALERNMPFHWKLVEVPGIGHSNDGMVKAAVDEIFGTSNIPQALVLRPTQDATIKANYPAVNYGNNRTLHVDGNSEKSTYIKFDLSEITDVKTAVLRLQVTDPSNGIQSISEAANNNWNEFSLTYNNQPGIAGQITEINDSSTGRLSIDLTDYIRDRLGRVITLILSSSDRDGLYFNSRESDTPPQLELYQ
ncbi:MAG: DNRLRE domain-containing protein [Candidatus Thiodiazotropha sp.]